MNDYPSYDQLVTSGMDLLDDIAVDRSTSGAARSRSFYPSPKRRFTVEHLLDDTDYADLLTFYTANRGDTVSLTWDKDGQAYTCLFAQAPKPSFADHPFTRVTVVLEEQ